MTCRICDNIDKKLRRRGKMVKDVNRWTREGHRFRSGIEKALGEIRGLESEIITLYDYQKARINQKARISGIDSGRFLDLQLSASDLF